MKCRVTYFFFTLLLFISCRKQSTITFSDELADIPVLDTDISLVGDPINIGYNQINQLFPYNTATGSYGFASLLRLNDSTLLAAAARYKDFNDFKSSDIVAKKSMDNGKTWSNEYLLQENFARINIMAPSLLRITQTHLMLFFGVKNSMSDFTVYFKESQDNGTTWNSPRKIDFGMNGYSVKNNDRVLLHNNRIIVPIAFSRDINKEYNSQIIICLYSDNLGKSWSKSNFIKADFALMEPGITPTGPNDLLMTIRSMKGFVYFSRSYDNGKTWKELFKSSIQTPEAPQTIARVRNTDTLIMIWNNRKYTPGHENRNLLTFAYSANDGRNWKNPINIQSDTNFNYFYPTVFIDRNDTIHLTYGIRRRFTYRPSVQYERLNLRDLIK